MSGTYAAALRAGRSAATAKRWGEASTAFREALAARPDDPTALNELSWALLAAGDAPHSLEAAELAIGLAADPKQKAAALYNAGRALEALGDLPRARSLLEASFAMRASDIVEQRLTNLAAPVVRPAPTVAPWNACQGLPSAEAVCDCLAASPASAPSTVAQCEALEPRGERGRVVVLSSKRSGGDLIPGRELVLVARTGATWSALVAVDESGTVDLAQQPRAAAGVTVSMYEELPYRGGTLHWVQTTSEFSETATRRNRRARPLGAHPLLGPS